jgi:copper chaperone
MYSFQVNDMTCGHCVSTVERAVKSVDASAQVRIDLPTGKVAIQSDKPAVSFADAISEAGYSNRLET